MNTSAVDIYIQSLPPWQSDNMIAFRHALHEVAPTISEDVKWHVPVFMLGSKMIFAMSAFKAHTKYNFIHNGASLADPDALFNNGFDSKKSRGIDLRAGDNIDIEKLKSLIKSSIDAAGL